VSDDLDMTRENLIMIIAVVVIVLGCGWMMAGC
jgi:hypothetical protein